MEQSLYDVVEFNMGFIKYIAMMGSMKSDEVKNIMSARKKIRNSIYGLTNSSVDSKVRNIESGLKNILEEAGLDTSRY